MRPDSIHIHNSNLFAGTVQKYAVMSCMVKAFMPDAPLAV